MSEFLGHKPCIGSLCSSSDGLAVSIDDGGVLFSKCFVCEDTFGHNRLAQAFPEIGVAPIEWSKRKETLSEDDKFNKEMEAMLPVVKKREKITKELNNAIKSNSSIKGNMYRNIKDSTLERFRIRTQYDQETGEPVVRYYPVTSEYKLVGYKKKVLDGKQFMACPPNSYGNESDLFGEHLCKDGGSVLFIVGGEEDVAAAWQILNENNTNDNFKSPDVVSPITGEGGCSKQIRAKYEFFDKFDKIVVAFDNDEAGKKATSTIAPLLPSGKVYVAVWPDGDPCDSLMSGNINGFISAFYKSLKTRYVPQGITSSTDLEKSMREYVSMERLTLPTFMETLQKMLAGGIPFGYIVNLLSASGTGKCHGKGTKVLMHDMSVKLVEDIVVGEYLMSPDGSAREVLSIHTGQDNLYRVKQNKGEDYTVNSEHVLSLKSNKDVKSRGFKRGGVVNISTKEFIELPKYYKNSVLKGYTADLTNLGKNGTEEDHDLLYLIGLWLADGARGSTRITVNKSDVEIVEFIKYCASKFSYKLNTPPTCDKENCTAFDISKGFFKVLDKYGVRQEKSIPKELLTMDYQSRLQLLAGILDGDAHLTTKNTFEVCLKDTPLVEGVIKLARSVGLRVTVRDKFSKCQNFDGATYKRVSISGSTSKIPNILTRKKAQHRMQVKNPLHTGVSVEPIGFGTYYGFSVDKDNLYCLGDFTVTHNSTFCDAMILHWIMDNPHTVGIVSLEASEGEYAVNLSSSYCGFKLNLLESANDRLAYLDKAENVEKRKVLWERPNGKPRFYLVDSDVSNLQKKIEQLIVTYECKVICLDPLQDIFDMLSKEEQNKFMSWEKEIVKKHQVIMININHARKSGQGSKANSTGADLNEEDIHGVSSIFKSGGINIILTRDKEAEDPVARNTTYCKLTKARGVGNTGPAGAYYYEQETHKLHNKSKYFKGKS